MGTLHEQFDADVARHFAPLAARASLKMQRVCAGLYQFGSSKAVVRLRAPSDGSASMLVTIRPAPHNVASLNDLGSEISLHAIAKKRGIVLSDAWISDRPDSAATLAGATERLLLPFVLGTQIGLAELGSVLYAEARARARKGLESAAQRRSATATSAARAEARTPGTGRPRSPAGSSRG